MIPAADRLATTLARHDARRAKRGLPAPIVLVEAPGLRLEHGELDRRFHPASVDKVVIAAMIARLADEGRLALHDPLGRRLPGGWLDLPAAPGIDPARDITVEHLLTHTSGLPEAFEATLLTGDLARRWTRDELLDLARAKRPLGRPGERFGYTDTAYWILQRIIEEATGLGYREAIRRLVLDPAEMAHTAMPFDDEFDPAELAELELAPMVVDGVDVSRAASLSAGWGSIVTTAGDLVRFQRALHGGLLASSATIVRLARPRHRMRPGIRYGAGLATIRFGEMLPILLSGLPSPVGGLGLTAVHAFWYPEQRAHVVLEFHADAEMGQSFQAHIAIARELRRLGAGRGPAARA